ncbi:MAG TPA: hypothetical protein VKS60_14480 [Stellaceae bacterium]|nr:hypothetical protein [Stellaceae bacterium]
MTNPSPPPSSWPLMRTLVGYADGGLPLTAAQLDLMARQLVGTDAPGGNTEQLASVRIGAKSWITDADGAVWITSNAFRYTDARWYPVDGAEPAFAAVLSETGVAINYAPASPGAALAWTQIGAWTQAGYQTASTSLRGVVAVDGASITIDGQGVIRAAGAGGGGSGGAVTYLPWADPTAFGAKGDAQEVTDVVATAGSAIVTSASANWQPTDVGKVAVIHQGTDANTNLVTTIAGRQSATQVTLTATVANTPAQARMIWGTLDTAAFQAALAVVNGNPRGGTLMIPAPPGGGQYLIDQPLLLQDRVTAQGMTGATFNNKAFHTQLVAFIGQTVGQCCFGLYNGENATLTSAPSRGVVMRNLSVNMTLAGQGTTAFRFMFCSDCVGDTLAANISETGQIGLDLYAANPGNTPKGVFRCGFYNIAVSGSGNPSAQVLMRLYGAVNGGQVNANAFVNVALENGIDALQCGPGVDNSFVNLSCEGQIGRCIHVLDGFFANAFRGTYFERASHHFTDEIFEEPVVTTIGNVYEGIFGNYASPTNCTIQSDKSEIMQLGLDGTRTRWLWHLGDTVQSIRCLNSPPDATVEIDTVAADASGTAGQTGVKVASGLAIVPGMIVDDETNETALPLTDQVQVVSYNAGTGAVVLSRTIRNPGIASGDALRFKTAIADQVDRVTLTPKSLAWGKGGIYAPSVVMSRNGAGTQQNNAFQTSTAGHTIAAILGLGQMVYVHNDSVGSGVATIHVPSFNQAPAERVDHTIFNDSGAAMSVAAGSGVALSSTLTLALVPAGSTISFALKLDGDGIWRQAAAHCTVP